MTSDETKNLLEENLPFLLDSLEHFDWTKITVPKKFEEIKHKQFQVELLDSVTIEKKTISTCIENLDIHFSIKSKAGLQTYNLDQSLLSNKKLRKINLVRKNSNDRYTLTVVFSNLLIDEKRLYACMVVTKKIGISMKKDIYYFAKKNNKWKYSGRTNISIG